MDEVQYNRERGGLVELIEIRGEDKVNESPLRL